MPHSSLKRSHPGPSTQVPTHRTDGLTSHPPSQPRLCPSSFLPYSTPPNPTSHAPPENRERWLERAHPSTAFFSLEMSSAKHLMSFGPNETRLLCAVVLITSSAGPSEVWGSCVRAALSSRPLVAKDLRAADIRRDGELGSRRTPHRSSGEIPTCCSEDQRAGCTRMGPGKA